MKGPGAILGISRPIVGLTLGALVTAACGGGGEGTERSRGDADTARVGAYRQLYRPAHTTAASVWAHLRQQNYGENWHPVPGKGQLYPGSEPHGALLTTYLNFMALDALTNGAARYPAGVIIVMENYAPDSTLSGITVMYRVGGYDPEHDDWWWMKRRADGTVEVAGRAAVCIGCHGGGDDADYIMTEELELGSEDDR